MLNHRSDTFVTASSNIQLHCYDWTYRVLVNLLRANQVIVVLNILGIK